MCTTGDGDARKQMRQDTQQQTAGSKTPVAVQDQISKDRSTTIGRLSNSNTATDTATAEAGLRELSNDMEQASLEESSSTSPQPVESQTYSPSIQNLQKEDLKVPPYRSHQTSDEEKTPAKKGKKDKKKTSKDEKAKRKMMDALKNYITVDRPWGFWGQPLAKDHPVRSKTYMKTKKKLPSEPLLFRTVGCQAFIGKKAVEHAAQYPFSWYQQNKPPAGGFTFIHSIQINSLGCAVVSYHYCPDKSKLPKLFQQFIEKDDDWRNSRLKMIPRIVDGPWVLRSSVRNVPAIVGKKLTCTYHKGEDYLEMDMLCDSNFMASWIIGLARPMSKSVVCELCWTIEGQSPEELPERLFAGCIYGAVDFDNFTKVTFDENDKPISIQLSGEAGMPRERRLSDLDLGNKVEKFYCETRYQPSG